MREGVLEKSPAAVKVCTEAGKVTRPSLCLRLPGPSRQQEHCCPSAPCLGPFRHCPCELAWTPQLSPDRTEGKKQRRGPCQAGGRLGARIREKGAGPASLELFSLPCQPIYIPCPLPPNKPVIIIHF